MANVSYYNQFRRSVPGNYPGKGLGKVGTYPLELSSMLDGLLLDGNFNLSVIHI